jgi:hypothetical protein
MEEEMTVKEDDYRITFDDIRKEVNHEHSMLNQRVGWLVTSQAFLFVPLVLGIKSGVRFSDSLFYPLVPLLGVVICALTLLGIIAAIIRINDWKFWQYRLGDKNKQSIRPVISLHGKVLFCLPRSLIPALGFIPALGLPIALLISWLYIFRIAGSATCDISRDAYELASGSDTVWILNSKSGTIRNCSVKNSEILCVESLIRKKK